MAVTTVNPSVILQKLWRYFCGGVVRVFYRKCEVEGLELLPAEGPVLLCANHTNSLADVVVILATSPRPVHPLARSGLFKMLMLRPALALLQAVPVYRRQDNDGDTSANVDSFARCYDMFARGEVLLIFPEGISHSDPRLHPIKTGAARMVLGAKQVNGCAPLVLPVGLNFTQKGKFGSSVFVRFGEPLDLEAFAGGQDEDDVRRLTAEIQKALEAVTLNVDTHLELQQLSNIERFFAMRHGKYRRRNLRQRFRALSELNQAYHELRRRQPRNIERLRRRLHQFERLCKRWGVHDYHLTVSYRPGVVTRFILRSLTVLFLILPLAAWGIVNSIVPFLLTRHLARLGSEGSYHYDTAKMTLGLFLFSLFWGAQTGAVYYFWGMTAAVVYAASLPVTAAAAMLFRRERGRIWENLRVFFLFVRKRKLRRYLEARRNEIEAQLAQLVRHAKRSVNDIRKL